MTDPTKLALIYAIDTFLAVLTLGGAWWLFSIYQAGLGPGSTTEVGQTVDGATGAIGSDPEATQGLAGVPSMSDISSIYVDKYSNSANTVVL